ncbi:sensor protein VanSB [Spirochaetia bacterium]|nr:sensor protein VanSB [Spirochaetia bacterium]
MKQDRKIFTKVFAYTMLLMVLMILVTVALFAQQFLSFYRSEEMQQLTDVFQPVISQFEGKTPAEIAELARDFANKNQTFSFVIEDAAGNVLFATPQAEGALSANEQDRANRMFLMRIAKSGEESTVTVRSAMPGAVVPLDTLSSMRAEPLPNGPTESVPTRVYMAPGELTLRGITTIAVARNYGDLALRSLLALMIMLAIGALGAVIFALKVTKPLEDEIVRERMMEENQRHFFSAASHELKTPIAATNALIEGMIANVGDYRDHPKYLRECLRMLNAQNRLVSEILEIVNLSDEKVEPVCMPLPLAELVTSVLSEYRAVAERNGQTITADIPGITISADRNMFRRALSNVISNAVQNTTENETIHLWTGEETGGTIRLNILNPKAHIDGEILQRLFEPLYRIDAARNRNASRSGLGLTIVKKALDRMGIAFALENTEQGVLFWMDLALIR